MKGRITMILISAMLLGLTGCHAPADTAVTQTAFVTETQTYQENTTASPMPTGTTEAPQTLPPETQTTLAQSPEPEEDAFVRVADYLPGVLQELPYATVDNFTGHTIYGFSEVYLRYGTVKKLSAVCGELSEQGLSLKIWDGFRPVSAQFKLWEVYPNDTYVANPNIGFSAHSRGNTVDVTLVDMAGNELEMPTGFDDFTAMADRDYSEVPEIPKEHALLLQNTMEKYGFKGYFGEWWHFQDSQSYPVEKEFEPVEEARYRADCQEYINLRTQPDSGAKSIAQIPRDGEFTVVAVSGEFALAQYQGLRGYVHRGYIQPVEE